MNESSLAHTKWGCTYHIVWIPKYRRKILYGEYRKEIGSIIRELIDKKKGCEIVEGGLCADHIHLCFRVPPKMIEFLCDVMLRFIGALKQPLKDTAKGL